MSDNSEGSLLDTCYVTRRSVVKITTQTIEDSGLVQGPSYLLSPDFRLGCHLIHVKKIIKRLCAYSSKSEKQTRTMIKIKIHNP